MLQCTPDDLLPSADGSPPRIMVKGDDVLSYRWELDSVDTIRRVTETLLRSVLWVNEPPLLEMCLDKWQWAKVVERISKHKNVSNSANWPTTWLLACVAEFYEALRYSPHGNANVPTTSWWVKPRYGRGGKGILKICRVVSGGYHIELFDKRSKFDRSIVDGVFPSKSSLWKAVQECISGMQVADMTDYIVQTGIEPLYSPQDGKHSDLRVHCQRTGSGDLQVVGMVGRVGGSCIQGGMLKEADEMLEKLCARSKMRTQTLLSSITKLVKLAVSCMEEQCRDDSQPCETDPPLLIGEVGFDVVVTTDGCPVIIEANATNCADLFAPLSQTTPVSRYRQGSYVKAEQKSQNMARHYVQYVRYLALQPKRATGNSQGQLQEDGKGQEEDGRDELIDLGSVQKKFESILPELRQRVHRLSEALRRLKSRPKTAPDALNSCRMRSKAPLAVTELQLCDAPFAPATP